MSSGIELQLSEQGATFNLFKVSGDHSDYGYCLVIKISLHFVPGQRTFRERPMSAFIIKCQPVEVDINGMTVSR